MKTSTSRTPPAESGIRLRASTRRLANGLTLVASPEAGAPVFGVSVLHCAGFRREPRPGLAHLLEHLLFQGTRRAPKGTLRRVVDAAGGLVHGVTRHDYLRLGACAPTSALEPLLWLEADRMRALDLTEQNLRNQKEVVKEEIRVQVLNATYGLFHCFDLRGLAFDRWENGHNGYGTLEEVEALTAGEAEAFFRAHCGPANAVVALAGSVGAEEALDAMERAFGGLAARPAPPPLACAEGPNRAERWLTREDPLAQAPALALGWKLPGRASSDHAAASLLGQVLAGGAGSRLQRRLVGGDELASQVSGGVNYPLGGSWDDGGPVLLEILAICRSGIDGRRVADAVDEEVARIVREGIPPSELARARARLEAGLLEELELPESRAFRLALGQLLEGDPGAVNREAAEVAAARGEELQRVALTLLTRENRSSIHIRMASPT